MKGKNDEVELEDRALDAMFEAQRWTHDEEEAAKRRAAAEAVLRLVRVSAEEELHRKRKLEDAAKQQEEDAKRQKQEEDERKLAAKTCGDDPRPKLDFVVIEMEFPKASVGVRGDQVILASSEATNKKVPKDAVLVSWTIDVSFKADFLGMSLFSASLCGHESARATSREVRVFLGMR